MVFPREQHGSRHVTYILLPDHVLFVSFLSERSVQTRGEEQYKVHSTQCIYIFLSLYLVNRCKQMYLYLIITLVLPSMSR